MEKKHSLMESAKTGGLIGLVTGIFAYLPVAIFAMSGATPLLAVIPVWLGALGLTLTGAALIIVGCTVLYSIGFAIFGTFMNAISPATARNTYIDYAYAIVLALVLAPLTLMGSVIATVIAVALLKTTKVV